MRRTAVAAGIIAVAVLVTWLRLGDRTAIQSPERLFRDALAALENGCADDLAIAENAMRQFADDRRYWRHLAVLKAVEHLRNGEPEEALQELADEPMDSPVREYCLLYIGESLYRLQQLARAQQVFEQLRHDYPDNADGIKWMGAVYYDLGAYDAAITQLKAATKLQPEDYGPWHLLGAMYQDFEATEDAIRHLQEALDRNPPPPVQQKIRSSLADVLVDDRQYEAALQVLEQTEPDAKSRTLKAQAHWSLGQQSAALTALRQAEQADPDAVDVRLLRARVLEQQGQMEQAIERLQQILNDAPDQLQARYELAIAFKQVGRTDEAEVQLQEWQRQRQLADELIELNLKAVSDPANAEVRDRLAEICDQLGRSELANMWRKAAAACRDRAALRQKKEQANPSAAAAR